MAVREKLSISLDRDVVKQVRKEAGEGHVSEWLNAAALLRLQATGLARLMVEHGVTLSADLLAEVEAEWPHRD
jgi:riboflavin biosynthesis pyrimidine reductase